MEQQKYLHRLKMEQFLKYMCKSIKNTPSSPNALVPQNLCADALYDLTT